MRQVLTLFSILGMNLFGHVAHGPYLNADANFCSFPVSMLTMLRCSTGESWNGIMHDLMIRQADVFSDDLGPRCSDERGDCGSPLPAILFHISFQVLPVPAPVPAPVLLPVPTPTPTPTPTPMPML